MRFTTIDLFAGAGGLAGSLETAGWRCLSAVDIDRDAVETLRLNQLRGHLRGTRIVRGDVRDLRAVDLVEPGERVDLLSGGPPCQPFSSAGSLRGLDDPRGRLFHEFVRLADELKPRFVLFENVAGLVTAKTEDGRVGGVLLRVQSEFEAVGYGCRFELLNAADFGAPQRRVRLYMIASRKGAVPAFPVSTHAREPLLDKAPWATLGAFLATQPEPSLNDVVVPKGRRAEELHALLPGTGLRSGGIVEANRPGGHWGYRQDCFLADPFLPSRTIRAASTPDWLRMLDGGLRRLTWRECAGLQGFPIDWVFAGNTSSRFRQIGNAVQGHVGRAIGAALLSAAKGRSSARPQSVAWPENFHKRVRYTAMEEVVNGAHRRAARERVHANSATKMV